MRTTVTLDKEQMSKAILLTGIKEKSILLKKSLSYLIEIESSKKLADFGGTEKRVKDVKRRRPEI
ncbi:MAG: type II toxin-antitoxin system VapB family antitoxin [Ignavibacteriaceae bacterium]|nr:type II toxin-antitoxin system VapB family antitoxin [Ignavibacteriaceae bacterium]